MSNNSKTGNDGGAELKVTGDSGLHGAAVTMDAELGSGVRDDDTLEAKATKDDAEATDRSFAVEPVTSKEPSRPEHKKQLHERVEARRQDLESALLQLRADESTAPAERVLAIQTALQGLDTHLGGGWEHVGEVEAAQLAQWLEATQFLGMIAPKDDVSPPADGSAKAEDLGGTGDLTGKSIGSLSGQPAVTPVTSARN